MKGRKKKKLFLIFKPNLYLPVHKQFSYHIIGVLLANQPSLASTMTLIKGRKDQGLYFVANCHS